MSQQADLDIIIRYLNHWDPAGEVADDVAAGNVPEAYDSYAKAIHALLAGGISAIELTEHFAKLQSDVMGLPCDREKAEQIASGLVACFQSNKDRFY